MREWLQSLLLRPNRPSETVSGENADQSGIGMDVSTAVPDVGASARASEPQIEHSIFQLKFAETVGWAAHGFEIAGNSLTVYGWALRPTVRPRDLQFVINGQEFTHVEWPRPSPGVAQYFGLLPGVDCCAFACRHDFSQLDDIFPDGYACVACVQPYGINSETYRKAQFMLDPRLETPLPEESRIQRVIQGDVESYRIGGATLVKRLDEYLRQRFGRPLSSFESVLDWGCGAGRATRHLVRLCHGQVTGIDIDADNIAWCARALPDATFAAGPLRPPLSCPDQSFDLVIAISVFTHLDEETQLQWLGELRRIVRPGGLVLASLLGLTQMVFYGVTSEQLFDMSAQGIFVSGQNDQLDGLITDRTYYKNVMHSHDYVRQVWSRYFDVVEIVEGIANSQDLVALRRT